MELTLHCISIWAGIQSRSDQNKNWQALIPCSLFGDFLYEFSDKWKQTKGLPFLYHSTLGKSLKLRVGKDSLQ